MFLKHISLLSICISLFFSIQLQAQKSEKDAIKGFEVSDSKTDSLDNLSNFVWKSSTSVYLELMGKGLLSLNIDFRRKESFAFSVGFQPMEGFMPNIMFYHFGGTRHRFELGGGFSGGFNNELELKGMLIHGVMGFRSQKNKGLIFRAGFTPLYVIFFDEKDKNRSNKFYPLVGLSLGYSF